MTWDDHADLAKVDIADEKLIRQNLETLEGLLKVNEAIKAEEEPKEDNRIPFSTAEQKRAQQEPKAIMRSRAPGKK